MQRLVLIFLLHVTLMAQAQYIPKFDVQGHRGARGLKPENTIPAFIAALDYGVTTLEMDLAVTSDKMIVVSHDPWMSSDFCLKPDGDRISGREEKAFNIYQMTYEEVRRFDCGTIGNKDFPEQEKMVVNKPLLKDVIVAVEDHIKSFTLYEVDYNIEIKSTVEGDGKFHPEPEEFSDLVYQLLDQYLPLERVVIQSFDTRVLKYWHQKYPAVRLALLVENLKSVDSNLQGLGFEPSIYSPYFKLLSKDKVEYLHRKKIRVMPWTVNEISDIKKMQQWNVDGVITDYPNRTSQLGLGIKLSKK